MKKISFTLLFLVFTSCIFAPGSYSYAEVYEFEVPESKLIEAVNKFKKESKYNLPSQKRFKDGKRNEKDHWYHIWFYYPTDNKIVKCWIRGNKIALVGLGDGFDLKNYMEINSDFSRKENKKEKEKFEKLILDKIREYLQ